MGAIDGTHIPVVPERGDSQRWRDRHGNLSQNVVAACSFDMLFTYILAGWEGSTYDARVLRHALSDAGAFEMPPPGN